MGIPASSEHMIVTRSAPYRMNPETKANGTLSGDSRIKRSSSVLATSADNPDLPELTLVLRMRKLRHDFSNKFPGKHEKRIQTIHDSPGLFQQLRRRCVWRWASRFLRRTKRRRVSHRQEFYSQRRRFVSAAGGTSATNAMK